jgi:predicted nucleic acid-binding Zn ribbon protein
MNAMTVQNEGESGQTVSDQTADDLISDGLAPPNYLHQLSLPLSQSTACSVCGTPFEILRRRGRPQQFCSDACRDKQLRQQKARWSAANWKTVRRGPAEASE